MFDLFRILPFLMAEGDGGNGDSGNDGDGDDAPYYESFENEETRNWAKSKGYKSPEEQMAGHHELEKIMGTMIKPPTAESTDEDWAAIGKIIGPESVDAYKVEIPEGMEAYFNQPLINSIKEECFADGIPARYVNKIFERYIAGTKESIDALNAEAQKIIDADIAELKKDWKADYEKNDEYQRRGWDKVAEKAGIKKEDFAQFAKETGWDTHPIMKKIGMVIGRLYADAFPSGGPDDNEASDGLNEPLILGKDFYKKTDSQIQV